MMGSLHEDIGRFVIIFLSVLLRMKKFQTNFLYKIKTHILRSATFFPTIMPFKRLCGKMWYSQRGYRWQNNKRMCIACWITRATNTHSEYVILNALRRQQCLHECVSVLFCILKIIISARSAVKLIKNYG